MPLSRADLHSRIQPLLDPRSAADALATYYAFHHPANRTELFVPEAAADAGFLVRARTGMDLFRPLVTFRASEERVARELFSAGLVPGRPVYLTVPEALAAWVNRHLSTSDAEIHRVYRCPPDRHRSEINVLVQTGRDEDGAPRCSIETEARLGAVAGVNWQTPLFAEIYVNTDPAVRHRGYGRSVVNALTGLLLKDGRTPLYVVAEGNDASIRLAEAVGFEDTGLREYVCQAVRQPG